MLDLSKEPDLGYVFYPYDSIEHPGHPRMDVIIHKKPTNRHFDPEKAVFLVMSRRGHKLDTIHVGHPWTTGNKYQALAGRILLIDHAGKRVEAFSFGGDLQIISDDDQTVCVLKSPAPIFLLEKIHCLPTWIASEAEIILARQKAHWDPAHPHYFEEHLAQIDPFLLYASCLQAIKDQPYECYLEEGALEHEGEEFVDDEIQRLKDNDQWPLAVPTPDELFQVKTKKE